MFWNVIVYDNVNYWFILVLFVCVICNIRCMFILDIFWLIDLDILKIVYKVWFFFMLVVLWGLKIKVNRLKKYVK